LQLDLGAIAAASRANARRGLAAATAGCGTLVPARHAAASPSTDLARLGDTELALCLAVERVAC
jgi:hypothetical protein